MTLQRLEMTAPHMYERGLLDQYRENRFQMERVFWHAYLRGERRARLDLITGQGSHLRDLGQALREAPLKGSHYLGNRSVPVALIRGSEGRTHDFDAAFRPLSLHLIDRWVSIATAWAQGEVFPPVVLVKLGEDYFVRDGHHRISIAHSIGIKEVDAEVTVWELEE